VGYTYMWAIEQWLWTTGWGCGIPDIDVSEPQSDDGDKVFRAGEMAEDFEDGGWLRSLKMRRWLRSLKDEEIVEGSDNEMDEGFEEEEMDEGFEDEETVEGEFGYSIF